MVLRVGKHRHLVLVAFAGNLRHARHKRRGNAAKPRLRIAHHEPSHQEEEPARAPVPKATPKRDLTRERADAENESVAVTTEPFRYLRDILGCVGAFAAVLLVNKNRVDERRGLFEHVLPRLRAIVDEDDMLKALLQLRKERKQLFVRIVGRNEYCKRQH